MPKQKQTQQPSERIERGIAPQQSAAQLAGILAMPTASVRDMLTKAGKSADGKYDSREALRIIVQHFRDKTGRAVNNEHRQRLDAANAEAAEIKTARERGELMLRSDCIAIWTDVATRMCETLKAASYIAPNHREKLAKEFREIKPDPVPED